MNFLVFHIASGHAFFTGIFLVIMATLFSSATYPVAKRCTGLSFALGMIAIVVSAAAIPYWCYGLMLIAAFAWFASLFLESWRVWARIALAAACVVAFGFELPYHINGRLRPADQRQLTVIGDSITAGMGLGDSTERWPSVLAHEHGLTVQDISQPGETAASALKHAMTVDITSSIVFVEIGGNDLLGSTTARQFQRDLDALLSYLAGPDRQIIMFELPLPPFRNEFGRIQRTMAHKHDVLLVPKLQLLSVLARKDATVDTIHLTQEGHHQMADCVWNVIRSAFAPGNAA